MSEELPDYAARMAVDSESAYPAGMKSYCILVGVGIGYGLVATWIFGAEEFSKVLIFTVAASQLHLAGLGLHRRWRKNK